MGKAEYMRGTDEDMQDIVDLADLVFGKLEEPHDFRAMLPKLYGTHRQTQDMHFLAKEDGKLVALVCLMPGTIRAFGESFSYCSIGTVCVHNAYRGKGHMKVLMDMALKEMEAQGFMLSALGGWRQRYEYFGFLPAGICPEYYTEKHNLEHYLHNDDTYDIKLIEIERDHGEELGKAHELYRQQDYHCDYSAEAFYDRLCSWFLTPYSIYEGDTYIGYGVLNGKDGNVQEMLLMDDKYVPHVYRAVMERFGTDSVRAVIPFWQEKAAGQAASFCEEFRIGWDNRYRIMNYVDTIRIFIKLKAGWQKLMAGKFVIGITGRKNICIEVSGDDIEVYETEEIAHTVMSEKEAVSLLFADTAIQLDKKIKERVPECAWQWLPLPLRVPGLDLC